LNFKKAGFFRRGLHEAIPRKHFSIILYGQKNIKENDLMIFSPGADDRVER
jgi:hypothetical protein